MKKALSILLAFVLLLSVFTALPLTANAEEADLAGTGGSEMEIKTIFRTRGSVCPTIITATVTSARICGSP